MSEQRHIEIAQLFQQLEKDFPEELGERGYYHPVDRGIEIRVAEKMAWFREQDSLARR